MDEFNKMGASFDIIYHIVKADLTKNIAEHAKKHASQAPAALTTAAQINRIRVQTDN